MKKNFNQPTLIIAILVLFISLFWVYLSIYSTSHKKQDIKIMETNVTILNPDLDTKVLEELNQRKY